MTGIRAYIVITLSLFLVDFATAQNSRHDSTQINPIRLKSFVIGSAALYSTSLIALDRLWYQDFSREGFHFFNDAQEWKQVDKMGHTYSAFHISSMGSSALQWSGVTSNKSYIWGGVIGVLFMTPIEIMDGYSSEYGASSTDFAFNLMGAALFTSQGLLWNETRVHPKFSFTRSDLAPIRPKTLGNNYSEELLKDYNGQTYWLSFDMSKLLTNGNRFPPWLNFAFGYGAHDMVYASDQANVTNGFSSYRQYYLSVDIDLTHIHTRSRWIKTLIYFVNMIHLPSPALEYSSQGNLKFHVLKF